VCGSGRASERASERDRERGGRGGESERARERECVRERESERESASERGRAPHTQRHEGGQPGDAAAELPHSCTETKCLWAWYCVVALLYVCARFEASGERRRCVLSPSMRSVRLVQSYYRCSALRAVFFCCRCSVCVACSVPCFAAVAVAWL
jgi:hypothetical protein